MAVLLTLAQQVEANDEFLKLCGMESTPHCLRSRYSLSSPYRRQLKSRSEADGLFSVQTGVACGLVHLRGCQAMHVARGAPSSQIFSPKYLSSLITITKQARKHSEACCLLPFKVHWRRKSTWRREGDDVHWLDVTFVMTHSLKFYSAGKLCLVNFC